MKKVAKIILLICCTFLFFIGTLYVAHLLGFNIDYAKFVKSWNPPEDPMYPTDEMIGTWQFDNDTETFVYFDKLVLNYQDGSSLTVPRATYIDIGFLNKNLKSSETRYISCHDGTCFIVYQFVTDGVQYDYYQHIVNTTYVYIDTHEPLEHGVVNKDGGS